MRKILNPYDRLDIHTCFACSSKNQGGLHMEFSEDGDFVITTWEPKPEFCGYHDVLHGGIQATLMDELAAWTISVKLKTAGVTSKIQINYKKPVRISKGAVTARAGEPGRTDEHTAVVPVELFDGNKELCTTAQVAYTIFSERVSKKKLGYPGYEAFFKNG